MKSEGVWENAYKNNMRSLQDTPTSYIGNEGLQKGEKSSKWYTTQEGFWLCSLEREESKAIKK